MTSTFRDYTVSGYTFRGYDAARDLAAVQRIWKECGWAESDEEVAAIEDFFSAGDTIVATIDGEPECCAHSTEGTIKYLDETLKLGAVSAITTSHISRKLGFAKKLTASLLAIQAELGMEVSALGMFDQGFYDKVGFGTGSYENWINFDPATLNVDYPFRPPKRLNLDDYEAIHHAMMSRASSHGNVFLPSSKMFKAELTWTKRPFGLGYHDGPGGTLSHFIWGEMKGEHGPYTITARAYQSRDQLLELLALVKSLGDQVHQIGTLEFGEIQLQDLLRQPMRTKRTTAKGQFEQSIHATAYWQMRMLNIASCLAKTHLNTPPIRFNLELTDPVADILDQGSNWRGLSGDYIIALGSESSATNGKEASLPALRASVNAFSRMWFGVRPASSLAITDKLQADDQLLRSLDESLRLPRPHLGWDF